MKAMAQPGSRTTLDTASTLAPKSNPQMCGNHDKVRQPGLRVTTLVKSHEVQAQLHRLELEVRLAGRQGQQQLKEGASTRRQENRWQYGGDTACPGMEGL